MLYNKQIVLDKTTIYLETETSLSLSLSKDKNKSNIEIIKKKKFKDLTNDKYLV